MKTAYDKVKEMSLEEMETFIYWVYMNGNLDGQYSHEDSPYTSYFGGQLLRSKSSEIPESSHASQEAQKALMICGVFTKKTRNIMRANTDN